MNKYNANPKGWKTGDCVVRAISTATNKSWDDVFIGLNEIAFKKKRVFNDPIVYTEYLKQLGWDKKAQPRFYEYGCGCKVGMSKQTVNEFIDYINGDLQINRKTDAYIITVAHHMTCVKFDNTLGKFELYDIWDCGNKTIRNYWIREGERNNEI